MKHVFAYLVILLSFFSCVKNEGINFTEGAITTPSNEIVHVTIPVAQGETDVAEKINKKLKSIISEAIVYGDSIDEKLPLEAQIDSFNLQYQNFKNEFPDAPMIWEIQVDGEVLYQSPEIITIALTIYSNTGGAHGISTITLVNFDSVSGENLQPLDLFNNLTAVTDMAKLVFDKQIEGKESEYFNSGSFELSQNIGFSDDGILFLYNVYEIAPYSTGMSEFTIPFDDLETYLNYH